MQESEIDLVFNEGFEAFFQKPSIQKTDSPYDGLKQKIWWYGACYAKLQIYEVSDHKLPALIDKYRKPTGDIRIGDCVTGKKITGVVSEFHLNGEMSVQHHNGMKPTSTICKPSDMKLISEHAFLTYISENGCSSLGSTRSEVFRRYYRMGR